MTKYFKVTLEQMNTEKKGENIHELRAATDFQMNLPEAKNLVEASPRVTIVLSDTLLGRFMGKRLQNMGDIRFYLESVEEYTPAEQPPIFG